MQKDKRIEDRALLDTYHSMRCIACNRYGCDPAHIKSVGSGGHDLPWNLMPLCRRHHSMQHSKGWMFMANKYPRIEMMLFAHGWKIDVMGKLIRDLIL